MHKHIIYAQDSGKVFMVVPAFHAATMHLIDRTESAGKHVAELFYDDQACDECGTESGVKLNRHADGSLIPLCEPCFYSDCA